MLLSKYSLLDGMNLYYRPICMLWPLGANFSGPGALTPFLITEQCNQVIMPADGSLDKAGLAMNKTWRGSNIFITLV